MAISYGCFSSGADNGNNDASGGSGGSSGNSVGGSAGGGGDNAGATGAASGSAGSAGMGAVAGTGAGGNVGAAGGVGGEAGSGEAGSGGAGSGTIASCKALLEAEPTLASGEYLISPDASAPFAVYCDMDTDGGGWTLVLNEGTGFMPSAAGVTDAVCYETNCTNRAYSTLPIGQDLMFDVQDGDIIGSTFTARVIVHAIHADTRGVTLRTAFTEGPFFVEAEDNSNVALVPDTACSTLPFLDLQDMLCGQRVLTLGDLTGQQCGIGGTLAVGGSESYTVEWANCGGWPLLPNPAGNYYPDNFRFWIR